MKYWIGVISGDHAKVAVAEGVCAFSHGKETPVAKLSVGDRIAYYAPRSGIGEGAPIQGFVALGTVTGDEAYQRQWAKTGFVAWVRDADMRAVGPIPVKPMLDDLSFIKNPRFWGMAFRRGQFEIPADDFARIEAQA